MAACCSGQQKGTIRKKGKPLHDRQGLTITSPDSPCLIVDFRRIPADWQEVTDRDEIWEFAAVLVEQMPRVDPRLLGSSSHYGEGLTH